MCRMDRGYKMNDEKAQVICLTPTKNEEWIIERFVKAASLWADIIIIADQMSTDKTVEIAKQYSKVQIVMNESETFNENERQKLLINEARKIPGKKLLLALDADEFLTANFHGSSEWKEMLHADEGTVFSMEWPFIKDDFEHYWEVADSYRKFAVMDDGSEHGGSAMHSVRIPFSLDANNVFIKEIKVMHFQYTDWKRMESKHLWYQCYEHVMNPKKSYFEIYRMYHHMYVKQAYKEIPHEWFEYYEDNQVGLKVIPYETTYWWDKEVEKYIEDYSADYFKYIDIKTNRNLPLQYLRFTQKFYRSRLSKAVIRKADRIFESIMIR